MKGEFLGQVAPFSWMLLLERRGSTLALDTFLPHLVRWNESQDPDRGPGEAVH